MYISGLFCVVFSQSHLLILLLGLETMYLGLVLMQTTNVNSLFTLAIAASESAVGLAIVVYVFKFRKALTVYSNNELRG